jgi:hypothetical protein
MNCLAPGQCSGAIFNGSCHFLIGTLNFATASEQNQSIQELSPAGDCIL